MVTPPPHLHEKQNKKTTYQQEFDAFLWSILHGISKGTEACEELLNQAHQLFDGHSVDHDRGNPLQQRLDQAVVELVLARGAPNLPQHLFLDSNHAKVVVF